MISAAQAEGLSVMVRDPQKAGARTRTPVACSVDLGPLAKQHDRGGLCLVEQTEDPSATGRQWPAQFEPESPQATRGTLWWLMPPGAGAERRFRLITAKGQLPTLSIRHDRQREAVEVTEGAQAVLRYNHGTVPPPPNIVETYERKRKPPERYARGDYIHPLFGLDGVPLTDDYSLDHPHHRGVSWAWPVVRWKGEARDLWAVRVLPPQRGGVWARPVALRRLEAGPVLALIDAENVWKWGDREPIVKEEVEIRAFGRSENSRVVDVTVTLTALVDELAIGGRPKATYGGFALRSFPQFEKRQILMHIDPPSVQPRRAWFHLSGVFPGSKRPSGVALLEHVSNPGYPNYPNPEGLGRIPDKYPPWRSVLPCFPGDREVPLAKGRPLVLRYRLWIHAGEVEKEQLTDVWTCYAQPPIATCETSGKPGP